MVACASLLDDVNTKQGHPFLDIRCSTPKFVRTNTLPTSFENCSFLDIDCRPAQERSSTCPQAVFSATEAKQKPSSGFRITNWSREHFVKKKWQLLHSVQAPNRFAVWRETL